MSITTLYPTSLIDGRTDPILSTFHTIRTTGKSINPDLYQAISVQRCHVEYPSDSAATMSRLYLRVTCSSAATRVTPPLRADTVSRCLSVHVATLTPADDQYCHTEAHSVWVTTQNTVVVHGMSQFRWCQFWLNWAILL